MPRLENWSVINDPFTTTPYTPPECVVKCLQGQVYGHDRFPDGQCIVTSFITKVNGGLTVTTRSGSVYLLGQINPDYLDWLRKQGLPYDENNPLRVWR